MLKPTHVRFECLRDKRANLFSAGQAIPDVSNIDTERVWYLPSHSNFIVVSAWLVGSSNMSREFWVSGVPTPLNATDLVTVGAIWPCSVLIPDVSGIPNDHITTSF